MEIREITNKEEWEGFLGKCAEKTFLQSWAWGDFNLAVGCKIWRFGAFSDGNVVAVSLVVKVKAKRGTFLFLPHGPVIVSGLTGKDKKEIFELLLLRLQDISKEEKASFIRVAPLLEENEGNELLFADVGFRSAPMHSSAYEATWKLDIFPPEEDLLARMRKTTRYLIRKTSENPDIKIEASSDAKDLAVYQKLNQAVARRQKFVAFSSDFIEKEFKVFNSGNQVLFLFGKYKGEIACGAMVIFWSGVAFYHQAASLASFSKLSIPYLLQWEAIKEAKRRGCKVYDFWGFTDPEKNPKHPWAGPTLFKMGFGGYKKEYIKTQDLVISWKYWINFFIEAFRKKKRNL